MRFKKSSRGFTIGMSVIALVGAMTACSGGSSNGSDSSSGGKCETPALAVISLTGTSAAYSIPQQAGINASVKVINDAGGVNGCNLVVDYADDNSDANQTLPVIQSALAKKDYAFVFSASYGTTGAIPYLVKKDLFTITGAGAPTAVVNPQATPHLFEISPSTSSAAGTAGTYAVKNGANKIAAVTDNGSLGTAIADSFKTAVSAAGGQVVDVEPTDPATVDFTPVIQRMQASGADTVYIDLLGTTSAHAVQAIIGSGWKPKVYIGTSATSINLGTVMAADEAAATTMFGKSAVTLPLVPGVQTMLDAAAADGDTKAITGGPGAAINGYSAFTIFAWGANGAKSTDAGSITKYLESNTATAVPNLPTAVNTGYSSSNHVFAGTDSLAVWTPGSIPGPDGFYPARTQLLTPTGGPTK